MRIHLERLLRECVVCLLLPEQSEMCSVDDDAPWFWSAQQ